MSLRLADAVAAFALASAPAAAQDVAADWERTRNPDADLVAATIQFDNGISLMARCMGDTFDLAIGGLPPTAEEVSIRRLGFVFGEAGAGSEMNSTWTPGDQSGVAFSRFPALMARSLAKGGTVQIVVPPEAGAPRTRYVMQTEPSAAALEETLTACGRLLVDPRDTNTEDESPLPGEAGPGLKWVRRPTPEFPGSVRGRLPREGYATLTCRTEADGRVSDCQVEAERPAGFNLGRSVLRAMPRTRLELTPEAEAAGDLLEGRVIAFAVSFRLSDSPY